MADRGLKALAGTLALVLVALIAGGTVLGSRTVAADLTDRVEAALFDAGLSDVAIHVTGREVELRPTTERDLVRATRVVEQVEGVRWARLDPSIGTADLRPVVAYLDLETTGRSLTISGAVHDAATAADLKASASAAFDRTVRGDLMIDPTLPEADWTGQLAGLFGDLASIKDVGVEIEDGAVLRLSGHVESVEGRDRVIALATSGVPELTVSADVAVEAGRLDAEDAAALNTFVIFYSAGGVDLTDADRDRIAAVADVLEEHPGLSLEVLGHTGPDDADTRGEARDRVDQVVDELVDDGVAESRLGGTTFVSGHRVGSDERYRRVDLVVKGA